MNLSYWVDSTLPTDDPVLDGDASTGICVIGGGIVGVTTAWLLRMHGHDVVLIDMHQIGQGVTGYTTGKVTSGHNLIYAKLADDHGPATAARYALVNQTALGWMRGLVAEHDIDCDWEARDNFVYVTDPERLRDVEAEVVAATAAGLPVHYVSELDLPFPIAGAIRLEDQAQFHARKYLLRLAQMFRDAGGEIYERTRATKIREGDPCVVETKTGQISCEAVVCATHYPFTDRSLLFARVHPKRSYAVTAPLQGQAPAGMFISADEPTRSIRTIPDGEETLLMVGGEGHPVGQETNTGACFERLEGWMTKHFEVGEVTHRWSAQDGVTVDSLPYVGRAWRTSSKVFLATGFGKWGFTLGTAAAHILSDLAVGEENEHASLFDPGRLTIKASAQRFANENAKVGIHFVGDRIRHPQSGGFEDLGPGNAAVRGVGKDQVAAYRDENGRLHQVSATCTHLGCIVRWNDAERTWDCPCHGSRFAPSGEVIEGPAVRDLPPVGQGPGSSRP